MFIVWTTGSLVVYFSTLSTLRTFNFTLSWIEYDSSVMVSLYVNEIIQMQHQTFFSLLNKGSDLMNLELTAADDSLYATYKSPETQWLSTVLDLFCIKYPPLDFSPCSPSSTWYWIQPIYNLLHTILGSCALLILTSQGFISLKHTPATVQEPFGFLRVSSRPSASFPYSEFPSQVICTRTSPSFTILMVDGISREWLVIGQKPHWFLVCLRNLAPY